MKGKIVVKSKEEQKQNINPQDPDFIRANTKKPVKMIEPIKKRIFSFNKPVSIGSSRASI